MCRVFFHFHLFELELHSCRLKQSTVNEEYMKACTLFAVCTTCHAYQAFLSTYIHVYIQV